MFIVSFLGTYSWHLGLIFLGVSNCSKAAAAPFLFPRECSHNIFLKKLEYISPSSFPTFEFSLDPKALY